MLTQAEANALIDMPKKRINDDPYNFPGRGEKLVLDLISENGRERFKMDVYRGRIKLAKCNYAELGRETIMLVRLDVGGRPHVNPEGPAPLPFLEPYEDQDMQCPHLHVYIEGHDAQWAIPAPVDKFTDLSDLGRALDNFFDYCNVIEPPAIQRALL